MEKWLGEHGRKIINWDEIFESGVSPTATVMSWRNSRSDIVATEIGNHVIMALNDFCYLNYYQTKDPLSIGGFVLVSKLCTQPLRRTCTGGTSLYSQCPDELLTEYIFTSTHLKHIQLSRLPSFAKVSWSYGPQGLHGFQAPHEHLSQMLQYRRLQLHHLFLRRPGRIKPNGR